MSALGAASIGVSFASPNVVGPGVRRVTRSRIDGLPHGFLPANINRHTGKPHEHKREIARRLRQQEN
ncbi:hypothetical protein C7W88_16975 [Novosphingobium sp. THN1]|nr:hypothetical protein C7W88_16975 [Novosphingobium sp. THN1]